MSLVFLLLAVVSLHVVAFCNPLDQSEVQLIGGLYIVEDESLRTTSTAGSIWPAGQMLAEHLAHYVDIKGKVVLELGSGTGIVGIAAAVNGASRVLLTDINPGPALTNVERLRTKLGGRVDVYKLVWGSSESVSVSLALDKLGGYPDVVLGGDVVYAGFDLAGLLETLLLLAGNKTKVVLSYLERLAWTTRYWEHALTERGFAWHRMSFVTPSSDKSWVYVIIPPPLEARRSYAGEDNRAANGIFGVM